MSIPVSLPSLAEVMARYAFAYLLTGSERGAPRAVAVVPRLEGGILLIDAIGHRTRENLVARPEVGLVWPPGAPGDYSLIVDGLAVPDSAGMLRITPSRAVLHRPAQRPEPPEPGACGSDCKELPVSGVPTRAG